MSPQAPAAAVGPPKFKRSAKNYLLDRSFQLKYTGYIVGITLALSLALGAVLFLQSENTVRLAHEAVNVGQEANKAGRDAVQQSKALNDKLENDAQASYSDNPVLLEAIRSANKVESEKISKRALELASAEQKLVTQRDAIARQRNILLGTVASALLLLVIIIGLAGIVITHKVAGPIFKMKKLLKDVGEGKLVVPGKLRKGDELVEFFDVFATMVEKLRVRQEVEIQMVDAAIEKAAASGADEQVVAKLNGLRAHMQTDLDAK
ncbi:MAG: HAMP domain-containing protein [Polyangiales bacterium]